MEESNSTGAQGKRNVSNVGKNAIFGSPDEEVARIIAHKENYYICLKVCCAHQSTCLSVIQVSKTINTTISQVLKDSDPSDIRSNYLRLSRLVHPDKCNNPNAPAAAAIINQAKETLTNPLKKRLYDAYVADITASPGEDMSYADWEAAQAQYPVKIPKWLESILSIPFIGQIVILLLLVITLPLTIILLLLILLISALLFILCLPVRMIVRCIKGPPSEEEMEQQRAAFEAFMQGRTPPRQQHHQQGGPQNV